MLVVLVLLSALAGELAHARREYPTNVILSEGESLMRGQFGYSPSGVYSYGVSEQGSVQFRENSRVISETGPTDGTELKLQNGVLVFDGRDWTSKTRPQEGVKLIISDRGHAGLFVQFEDLSAGGSFWHRGIDAGAKPILDGPGPPEDAVTSSIAPSPSQIDSTPLTPPQDVVTTSISPMPSQIDSTEPSTPDRNSMTGAINLNPEKTPKAAQPKSWKRRRRLRKRKVRRPKRNSRGIN